MKGLPITTTNADDDYRVEQESIRNQKQRDVVTPVTRSNPSTI